MNGKIQIPRTIHFCWFGRGEKSKKIMKCMKSWEKHLPGYTLMEWNEDNFDLQANPYVAEAYQTKKYAFVSDYVRLHALYHYGGIYLDTDVEVVKALDDLLVHEAFSGFEDEQFLQSGTMGAVKGHPWIWELLQDYESRSFIKEDGSYDTTTNTMVITRICEGHGLITDGSLQKLRNGVTFYPRDYFSPYDYINGGSYRTANSYTIHHFAKSWMPMHVRLRSEMKRRISRIAGPQVVAKLRKMLT